MTKIASIILAAGLGTRMKSSTPKVLHTLAGKPILHWVLDVTNHLQLAKNIVIYGYGKDKLLDACKDYTVDWVLQSEQLGTGHAAKQAINNIKDTDQVLVLCGDVPLLGINTINKLIKITKINDVGIVTAQFNNPTGLGRIIRDNQQQITSIVEEKDADNSVKKITEINAGIYLFPTKFFVEALHNLSTNNTQQEYYLTDLIAMAVAKQLKVVSVLAELEQEVQGINDKIQLEQLERYVQQEQAKKLIQQGVQVMDANRLDIRTKDLTVGKDVVIDINVIISGKVTVGDNAYIGPNTILKDVIIGNGVKIESNSVLENAVVGDNSVIGPFARLRPGACLEQDVRIGNFVEVKKSNIGKNSKIRHLSYIGDSEVGMDVNIGAGTITCNYDGVNKHKTIIEDGAFIGSNSQLVAPVKVGKGATIAAGTTLTKDAPENKLTINKREQIVVERWRRPVKAEDVSA